MLQGTPCAVLVAPTLLDAPLQLQPSKRRAVSPPTGCAGSTRRIILPPCRNAAGRLSQSTVCALALVSACHAHAKTIRVAHQLYMQLSPCTPTPQQPLQMPTRLSPGQARMRNPNHQTLQSRELNCHNTPETSIPSSQVLGFRVPRVGLRDPLRPDSLRSHSPGGVAAPALSSRPVRRLGSAASTSSTAWAAPPAAKAHSSACAQDYRVKGPTAPAQGSTAAMEDCCVHATKLADLS